MTYPIIRKPYERTRSIADIPSDSKTIQDTGNETNINKIVARFARTGEMPPGNTTEPTYGDVTDLQGSLTDIIEKGRKAREAMDKLQLEQKIKKEKISQENAKKLKAYEKMLKESEQKQAPTTMQTEQLPET